MKKPSSIAIQERRDNRKGFVENIFKGMDVPVSIDKTISITDAMKIVAKQNEEFSNICEIDDAQLKRLWMDGNLAQYSGLIHMAVLSLADQYIGDEL